VIDETDPAIRAARAPFQQIRADLGDRFDANRAAYQAKLAEHEKYVAERTAKEQLQREAQAKSEPQVRKGKQPPKKPVRPQPVHQPQSALEEPNETGVFTVSWMTKG
jgi:hypothetical protein